MTDPNEECRQSPGESAVGPFLVPQPHGGALLSGGRRGGPPGPGRPPSALRALARERLAEVLPRVAAIAAGEPVMHVRTTDGRTRTIVTTPRVTDQLQAAWLLARTGLGDRVEVSDAPAGEPSSSWACASSTELLLLEAILVRIAARTEPPTLGGPHAVFTSPGEAIHAARTALVDGRIEDVFQALQAADHILTL